MLEPLPQAEIARPQHFKLNPRSTKCSIGAKAGLEHLISSCDWQSTTFCEQALLTFHKELYEAGVSTEWLGFQKSIKMLLPISALPAGKNPGCGLVLRPSSLQTYDWRTGY